MFTKNMAVAVLAVALIDRARTLTVAAQLRRKVGHTRSVYQNVRHPNWRKSRVELVCGTSRTRVRIYDFGSIDRLICTPKHSLKLHYLANSFSDFIKSYELAC